MFKLLKRLKNIKKNSKEAVMLNKKLGEATIDEIRARLSELESTGNGDAQKSDDTTSETNGVSGTAQGNEGGSSSTEDVDDSGAVAEENNQGDGAVEDDNSGKDSVAIEDVVNRCIAPLLRRLTAIEGQFAHQPMPEQQVENNVGSSNIGIAASANNGTGDEVSSILERMRNKR